MPCDICSDREHETRISARAMHSAVVAGFNPFLAGLIPVHLKHLTQIDSANEWRLQTLSGLLAHTDWRLCSKCAGRVNRREAGIQDLEVRIQKSEILTSSFPPEASQVRPPDPV